MGKGKTRGVRCTTDSCYARPVSRLVVNGEPWGDVALCLRDLGEFSGVTLDLTRKLGLDAKFVPIESGTVQGQLSLVVMAGR